MKKNGRALNVAQVSSFGSGPRLLKRKNSERMPSLQVSGQGGENMDENVSETNKYVLNLTSIGNEFLRKTQPDKERLHYFEKDLQ